MRKVYGKAGIDQKKKYDERTLRQLQACGIVSGIQTQKSTS